MSDIFSKNDLKSDFPLIFEIKYFCVNLTESDYNSRSRKLRPCFKTISPPVCSGFVLRDDTLKAYTFFTILNKVSYGESGDD